MTLIAGIISCDPRVPVPESVCETLRRSVSRNAVDKPLVFQDKQSFFAKLEIGAFGEAAVLIDGNKALTLVAGEPLLGPGHEGSRRGRDADTASIHEALVAGDLSVLRNANGVFSAIHYDPATGELSLIADKLGIRPLYYYVSDEFVTFASALRILEEIDEVPKVMDVRAVTEIVGLGYPLADRTPYADIKLLRAGEIVRISEKNVSHEKYWRWDEIGGAGVSEEELLPELFRRFETAVARRVGDDSATAAYLSGGLDSRCMVAALRDRGVVAHTFNFARPATQDQVFGRDLAAAVGAIHTEIPKQPGDVVPDYSLLMAQAWNAKTRDAERPHLVWSGEGGSVALGHVHLTEKIVEQMRRGDIDGAIDEHLERESAQVSPRLFRKDIAARLSHVINDGIREELGDLHATDPARNFYIHLLINDQHRKLGKHFENIDLHRLEFQLPFFDSSFLELIVSMPVNICLRHKLYVKWLSHFPPAVTAVPWQVYPGHEPCPVPMSEDLDYQWSDEYQKAERSARRRQFAEQASELFGEPHFPREVLNRRDLRLAATVHSLAVRDYGYLIGPARTYHIYSQKCEGRYVLPDD